MLERLACAALVGALLVPGCGGTTGVSGSGGSSAGVGGNGAVDAGCHLAVRVDACCNVPIPASAEEIDTDPCLVLYPRGEVDDELRAQCPLPDYCAVVDCASSEPRSRLVAETADGECGFVDECATDEDCAASIDHRYCCQCPAVFPIALIESEPCIGGSTGCADCSVVRCAECPMVDLSPTCSESVPGYLVCQ